MPSVDVIRNITIKGKADGVDDATAALNRLTASIAAANDNLSKSKAVAQDNADGFRITGEGALSAANHLRQAAEAAYVFSPAFRGVVNEMSVPVLKAASTALEGIALGLVTATNLAGTGLIKLGGAVETAVPAFAVFAGSMKATGAALEAFSPSLGGVATTILSRVLPALSLLGKGLLIYDAIKLVAEAWQLGGEKLAEYVVIAEKAAAANVTAEFLQRISKAATDAKLPVDDLTAALKKLNDSTAGKLGGSASQLAIDPLTTAGNFTGNSGVSQLQNANGGEEKLRALVSLYDQAVQKGERLAALDVIRATLGDTIAQKAALNNGYLDAMLVAADAISKEELVSNVSVANAVELQNRLDAAEKILSQRWHPIQDILTSLGIKMREAWVGIVEAVATAFDWVSKLVEKIADLVGPVLKIGATFASIAGNAAAALGPIGAVVGGAKFAGNALFGGDDPGKADAARNDALMADARRRLAEGMNRKFDTSTDPNAKPVAGPDTSAYDRATESVLKYIETTKAASLSVSDAAAAQEKFKVIAQLTAAGMKDGLTPEAARLKAEMSGLGEKAGAAADALAKAKEVSNIDFGRKTAFLSQADVQIATQLKGIYGNDIPAALNSTYAAGIRVNNAFKEISTSIETNVTQGLTDIATGAANVGTAFSNMGVQILKAIEQMIIKITIVQPLMAALQATVSGSGGILGLLGLGGGGLPGTVGSAQFGPIAPALHGGGIVGSEAAFSRYVHPAYFDDAPRFHTGGIAGDEVPIIAKRGEGVFTQGQMAAMGGGSSGPNITYAPNIDARGADAAAVARIATVMAQDRKNFERNVQAIVSKTRQNNPGSFG